MEYYGALGDPKGDLLMRYFMTEDEDVKAKALPEIRQVMNSLVSDPSILTADEATRKSAENRRLLSPSYSSRERIGLMALVLTGQVSWYVTGVEFVNLYLNCCYRLKGSLTNRSSPIAKPIYSLPCQ
jgi:hypothetical protein